MFHILIADPDPTTRKALILLLRCKLGTDDIVGIEDVETLIGALADVSPTLLLLDRQIYVSPTAETCQLLQEVYPGLKIILLSVDAGEAVAAKEAGAGFIHKGASPDELIATLTPLLRKE